MNRHFDGCVYYRAIVAFDTSASLALSMLKRHLTKGVVRKCSFEHFISYVAFAICSTK